MKPTNISNPEFAIFYYTNNLISPSILNSTLGQAIKHAKDNNCELILTSHFPLTKKYEKIEMEEGNWKEDIDKATGKRHD